MFKAIERAHLFASDTAIMDGDSAHTYGDLLSASAGVAARLLQGDDDLREARIAFMVDPGFGYAAVQWGIWRAGGMAVPLCTTHPAPALAYVLDDAEAAIVVASPAYTDLLTPICAERRLQLITLYPVSSGVAPTLPAVSDDRAAMMLYTSGTTGKPKGVVTTHANLDAQVATLIEAWEWRREDAILCILPLHHVHGIVNVLSCALWSGAACHFIGAFDAARVLDAFSRRPLTLFMAVPTVYHKLISHMEGLESSERAALRRRMEGFRLMVSGSAALPVSVMRKWEDLSGQVLLERYGMTEIGMAIGNPYRGERRPGYVGMPMPGVSVRLVDEAGVAVTDGTPGEVQVKGANVFIGYWRREEATRASFTEDGWFRTGDVAVVEDGYHRILGRSSVDIIKTGGYKVSALEIEEVLRTHPTVRDCAVVALPDEEWGERIVAAIVPAGADADAEELDAWIRTQLPAYKVPRRYLPVAELPRNAMGKVVKEEVRRRFG